MTHRRALPGTLSPLALLVLAFLVLLPAAPSTVLAQTDQAAGLGDEMVQANLEDVLLEDFIRFYSRYTGRNIVYRSDQIPKIKFNIYSQAAVSEPELSAIFNEVLSSSGLYAVSRETSLYVFPKSQAQRVQSAFTEEARGSGEGDELITTVYQLGSHLDAKDAVTTLKPMISQVGSMQPIIQANALLIQDTRDYVEQMIGLLNVLSRIRPDWQFEIIRLRRAEAKKIVSVINAMYAELQKRKQIADAPILQAVDWSNSVLFAGTQEQKSYLTDLLTRLDEVDQAETGFIKVYRLQSAKASTLADVLQSLVEAKVKADEKAKATGGEAKATPAAISGETETVFKVSADEESNSLIVLGTKEVFLSVDKIIEELDQPRDQVFVEALIMETTLTNSRSFGVEWAVGAANDNNIGQFGFLSPSSSLLSYAAPVVDGDPPNSAALGGGFSLGVLGNIISYKGEDFPTLGALVNFVKGLDEINILSAPQLMTLSNTEAEVFVGENRPYQTGEVTTDNNNTNVTYDYRDVGIKLKIKPYVNAERGLIQLDVEQDVKVISEATTDIFAPVTLNRYTKTSVQVVDGSTIVISGLVRDDQDRSKTAMPGLSQIPLLGWLFKREATSGTKSTLMVFISAKIIPSIDAAQELARERMQNLQDFHEDSRTLFESEFSLDSGDNYDESWTQQLEIMDLRNEKALMDHEARTPSPETAP